ncbi:DUF4898 domain-containing protein [Sulfolobus sp. S-194]|uniref:DUF4898 domain-containing protein n=1 Tax=Sulfolobus sp. S-194 TaxID=2512240 RepID=UPI00143716DD|nr:DUF4898 domain-containing protein [Sulfolobus sp. S-194]QIW24464.1 DUF4898 domain-containing protein [Sulfolobus sp. S-194]
MVELVDVNDVESLMKFFNFSKKLIIPIKIISDREKFFNYVLPRQEAFCIIRPKDYEIESVIKEIRKNPFYIFISEKLKDELILLY